MKYYLGLDIGGTKCAVTLAKEDNNIQILDKEKFPTSGTPYQIIDICIEDIKKILAKNKLQAKDIAAIGVSCGGPLDAEKGIIQCPPNLPEWDDIHICEYVQDKIGITTYLENDANACAVAEWEFGAGKGSKNMIFLTFGTGFGAGLILDGKLYRGTNTNAGEVGHLRLRKDGPIGYNKAGSTEGYCSGGGLAQIGKYEAKKNPEAAKKLIELAGGIDNINAKVIADLANQKDPLCLKIYKDCGRHLGEVLAMLIDLFNPERIVIGGIFMRANHLIIPDMQKVIDKEALPFAAKVCKVVPAGLGENVGDYAAIAIAKNNTDLKEKR